MNTKKLTKTGTVYYLVLYLVIAQTIITLKEYDLEHKYNIYLRTSCRSLALFLDQYFLKCWTKHLKVDQTGELFKGITHLGERFNRKLLLKQVLTHRLAIYSCFLHDSV